MSLPTVVIIGRPNVGKSRLFNRFAKKRVSIVHDECGITRDPIYAEVDNLFTLIDTGGIFAEIKDTPEEIKKAVQEHVLSSIEIADVLVFMIDGKEGCTFVDKEISNLLKKNGKMKQVILVANKMEFSINNRSLSDSNRIQVLADSSELGCGSPVFISAEHGTGVDFLLEKIREMIASQASLSPPEIFEEKEVTNAIKISFVGRPNVGKSSITNSLLNEDRCIVTDVPGTTRDAIDLPFNYKTEDGMQNFVLIDTAGLRAKSKQNSPAEYFSSLRTEDAIERSDVVFLVINAMEGITSFDQAIAGQIIKSRKPVVLLINKWDLMPSKMDEFNLVYKNQAELEIAIKKNIKKEFFGLPSCPIVLVSALKKTNIQWIPKYAIDVYNASQKKLSTGCLNRAISKALEDRPPISSGGKFFKCFYSVHIANNPIVIRLFCNRAQLLNDKYKRYLQESLIKSFNLQGCPIEFDCTSKKAREKIG